MLNPNSGKIFTEPVCPCVCIKSVISVEKSTTNIKVQRRQITNQVQTFKLLPTKQMTLQIQLF